MIYDLILNSLVGLDVILLELIEDLPKEVRDNPYWKPFMKKGWKTWASVDFYEERYDGLLIVEDNYYEINLPASLFKIIE